MSEKINQNGRSIPEMLGVLAIVGILSVGGIAGYGRAMMKYKLNKQLAQYTAIIPVPTSLHGSVTPPETKTST